MHHHHRAQLAEGAVHCEVCCGELGVPTMDRALSSPTLSMEAGSIRRDSGPDNGTGEGHEAGLQVRGATLREGLDARAPRTRSDFETFAPAICYEGSPDQEQCSSQLG